ncbi:hypothetical protein BD779DRAFT_11912 [Infundibulicybe gibba]|nr:hypothetical protein BD779DRAFT_11912 [Infundibulicybe gibba]
MDELLHYCLQELSFDGDLGCNVSRLRDFIADFYSTSHHPQNLDDSFCAFVWSLVVQEPTVHVGVVPPGVTSEVYIAPQISARRKAVAQGAEPIENAPAQLDIVPGANNKTLEELKRRYGDELRIAVDPDAVYAAITGSHIRFPKLSPMVYSALQIVTRGRESGVTVVELGQRSRYDQKTCFYLVRQLTELELVVKVRRGGVGSHFVIHKYFFDRSPSWKAIRDEENRAETLQPSQTTQSLEQGIEIEDRSGLHFSPIDSRHLSSLPLIRARVVKLLQASKNHIHAANNILLTLGFSNPTKTDRRFFQTRIRELIQQGIIEKVVVPSNRTKSPNASVACFRLVAANQSRLGGSCHTLPNEDDNENDASVASGIKVNLTIHRQIVDLLEESETTGMTLNELSTALCQFDKRTIELLLNRAEKFPPPPHFCDLGIVGLMETSGRERRHRYYTVGYYRRLVAEERFNEPGSGYAEVEFARVGDFYFNEPSPFYAHREDLTKYQDSFNTGDLTPGVGKPKSKAGSGVKGRPRKYPVDEDGIVHLPNGKTKRLWYQRKVESITDNARGGRHTESEGRPSKKRRISTTEEPVIEPTNIVNTVEGGCQPGSGVTLVPEQPARVLITEDTSPIIPKKRGRQPKSKEPVIPDSESPPAKRGRVAITLTNTPPKGRDSPTKNAGVMDETTAGGDVECRERSTSYPATDRPSQNNEPVTIPGLEVHDSVVDPATPLGSTPSQVSLSTSRQPPAPELKSARDISKTTRAKVNVSHLRRENEFYRVLEGFSGVINIQTKEFYDAHGALLNTMALAGEPTSSPPGTKIDKRTAATTIASLERQGRVKVLKTSVPSHTGINRPASIVYLPTVEEGELSTYLTSLARGSQPVSHLESVVKIDERVEYGADHPPSVRGTPALQILQLEQPGTDSSERWSQNITRANQLFSRDNETIRTILLTERTTLAQLYGYIPAKALRARALHLHVIKAFESVSSGSNIVSSEQRIVDVLFFVHDLPLELYCSLVSPLTYDEGLKNFMETEIGRQILIRDLPATFNSSLRIGRSRARSRIIEILQTLSALQLVVPLQPSDPNKYWISCTASGQHPSTFDIASMEGWSSDFPTAAPTYWHFKSVVPIHLWSVSETAPPVWQTVSVTSSTDADRYWALLQQACIDRSSLALPVIPPSTESITNRRLARSLRRPASWKSQYSFTWHQTRYLKSFTDISTAKTPLQEEDGGVGLIPNISWVLSAPHGAVRDFYQEYHNKLIMQADKAQKRSKKDVRTKEDERALLAKKAADARNQREKDWDELVARMHPSPMTDATAVRLRHIRTRFLGAGSLTNIQKWEREITDAVYEATIITKKALKPISKRVAPPKIVPTSAVPLPPPAANPPEKSVEFLIAQQGERLPVHKDHVRRKRKTKGQVDDTLNGSTQVVRRHRFQWNRDYDELARDASAIIRARCRHLPRLDWGAFGQVLPSVPRNTVRQRLASMRDNPGNEAYLTRLEDKWYDLWVLHRGTPLLPDEDLDSPTNFDLIKHVEFLRTHIDKNSLRVGFVNHAISKTTIPASVDHLFREFNVIETLPTGPPWDFMWNAVVEDGREKRLLRNTFSMVLENAFAMPDAPPEISVAESALKMVMGSPDGSYDPEFASELLHDVGKAAVSAATHNLLNRGVLSKLVRDPQKQRPGRQLKISEINQNAIGGSLCKEIFQDAAALEEMATQEQDWREWPLLSTDGDLAALVDLASENKVEFLIDTTQARLARPVIDWNSKKADDDQIETSINIRFINQAVTAEAEAMPIHTPPPVTTEIDEGCTRNMGQ